MRITTEPRKAAGRSWVAAALVLATAGCMDLEVENLLAPDRERATRNPADVEAFIGGAFHPPFFNAIHRRTQAVYLWPVAGSEFTATYVGGGTLLWYDEIKEPRIAHDNGASLSIGNGPWGPRFYWADVTQANTVAYDGLQLLNEGLVIREGTVDVTPRARAFAKFMQGWTWGYLALVFDRAHVVPETVDIPIDNAGLMEVTLESLVPHEQALAAALGALDEAIQIARQNPNVVRYPSFSESPLWFGSPQPVSNDLFVRMANTLAARLLVLNARTPEDRKKVNWARVLAYTANGLTSEDFERELSTGNRTSQLLLDAQRNTATSTTNLRWDYLAIGPADQSGAYQRWISATVAERDRFDIVTPDRRITGPTPRSNGSYTTYRSDNNGFDPDRGRYLFSAYQWTRHMMRHGLTGNTTGNDRAFYPLITADENTLLRAEALLRTGNLAGAADLINVTRTRKQRIGTTEYDGLPPVTAAGVPQASVCVPRRDDGSCGTLLDALRYERTVELAGMDVFRGYAEARGWGTLVSGSLLQWPVPGNALELYGLENYTYGGVGGAGIATYAPVSSP